jgi:hypothetical protein
LSPKVIKECATSLAIPLTTHTFEEEKCPADLLEVSHPDDVLAQWLSLFKIKARWIDGNKYDALAWWLLLFTLRLAGSMLPNIHLEHFTTDLLVCSDT